MTGLAFDLYYVRNKQKQETDFLITRERDPWLLIEAKLSDQPVEGHHLAAAEALGTIPVVQVCRQSGVAVAQRERRDRADRYQMLQGRQFLDGLSGLDLGQAQFIQALKIEPELGAGATGRPLFLPHAVEGEQQL